VNDFFELDENKKNEMKDLMKFGITFGTIKTKEQKYFLFQHQITSK
jgi:hypothetical protein